MALFIDSAYLDDITNTMATVPTAGVTTNPSIKCLAAARAATTCLKCLAATRAATTCLKCLAATRAAMIEADYIIPYYNRLERAGLNAQECVAEIAKMLHNQHTPTRILVASIKSAQEAERAILAGAHNITAAPDVLLEMLKDPQSEDAVVRFAHDWEKMKGV